MSVIKMMVSLSKGIGTGCAMFLYFSNGVHDRLVKHDTIFDMCICMLSLKDAGFLFQIYTGPHKHIENTAGDFEGINSFLYSASSSVGRWISVYIQQSSYSA